MKRIVNLTLLLLAVVVLGAFSAKTASSSIRLNKEISYQTQPGTDADAIKAGKDLYGMKCQKCHRLHSPDENTQDKWQNKVLPKMAKKAKLTDDELKSIETYLFANCKK
jgi:cytochrome c5